MVGKFKSVDRDIREHDFSKDDFDIEYTDSTCPFTSIVGEIKEPGMSYHFALNNDTRLDNLLTKKWQVVDPSRLSNRPSFSIKKRDPDERQCIRTGDTVLLERDERYKEREDARLSQKNLDVLHTAMGTVKTTTVTNILTPFRNKF